MEDATHPIARHLRTALASLDLAEQAGADSRDFQLGRYHTRLALAPYLPEPDSDAEGGRE